MIARLGHDPDREHGCCRIAYKPVAPKSLRDRLARAWMRLRHRPVGEPWACGQFCGHRGRCTWWTPGGYLNLAPPVLHPLDPLPGLRVGMPDCPSCGRVVFSVQCGPALWVVRDEVSAASYELPVPGASYEVAITLSCGCELREVLPAGC